MEICTVRIRLCVKIILRLLVSSFKLKFPLSCEARLHFLWGGVGNRMKQVPRLLKEGIGVLLPVSAVAFGITKGEMEGVLKRPLTVTLLKMAKEKVSEEIM